jgi:hypothetical protein
MLSNAEDCHIWLIRHWTHDASIGCAVDQDSELA